MPTRIGNGKEGKGGGACLGIKTIFRAHYDPVRGSRLVLMDLLTDVFKSIRLEGSIFFNSKLDAPWKLELQQSNRPRFHLVVEGQTWLMSTALPEPVCLCKGEALFLNDGGPHSIADTPNTEATDDAGCHLICGTFGFDENLHHPLIDTLPAHIRLTIADDQQSVWSMVRIMMDELDTERPGSPAVVDKLCELFLVHVLRSHAHDNPMLPGFVAALDDPVTCRALQLIHQEPETNWTLDSLANAAGLSRSAFAKRFHQLVGMPPGTYLTTWRMHKARRLLRNPTARMATVARQVGYSSDAAFNRAFRQFFGQSPGAFQAGTLQS